MDCEQFDRAALDLLYEEGEEYERGMASQHLGHCSRCSGVYSRLKNARNITQLGLKKPPPELEAQVLEQEHGARSRQNIGARLGRWMSIVAGFAMRQEVGMAALFLLMVGASLLFLKAKPGERDSVFVTEKGVPEAELDPLLVAPREKPAEVAVQDLPEAISKLVAATPADEQETAFEEAQKAMSEHHFQKASELFTQVATAGGPRALEAELRAAQADLQSRGCGPTLERLEALHTKAPGSKVGAIAAWEAGNCLKQAGSTERARRYFEGLLSHPVYAERAQRTLNAMGLQQPAAAAAPPKAESAPPPTPAQPEE